jgi:hypothetical protein
VAAGSRAWFCALTSGSSQGIAAVDEASSLVTNDGDLAVFG